MEMIVNGIRMAFATNIPLIVSWTKLRTRFRGSFLKAFANTPLRFYANCTRLTKAKNFKF